MNSARRLRTSALPALIAAAAALSGCAAPYMRLDMARGGMVVDRDGTRAEVVPLGLELGTPRMPSEHVVSFSAFERMELKQDWMRMGIAGQARFYAFRWMEPCGETRDCDVLVSGFVPSSGPFHTVIRGKGGVPKDALYMGKNNSEVATLGAFLEGDLMWSGPMVKGVDSKGKPDTNWNATFDRPLVLAGLFATTAPTLLGGWFRLGLEAGGEYNGVDMGMFGRLTLGFGITNAPSPPRIQDVPPPYVRQ